MTNRGVLATVLLLVGCGEDVGITVDCQSEPDMQVVESGLWIGSWSGDRVARVSLAD